MTTLPPSLKARVLEAARAHPSPPRRPHRPLVAALTSLAAVALPLLLWLWGGPGHTAGRPAAATAAFVAGALALALIATRLALPPARSMLPAPRPRLLAVVLGVPLLVGVGLLAGHHTYQDPFWRYGGQCLLLTLAAAPWPLAALWAASRRQDPREPFLSGAALGAAAGAWASLVVELWCPLADPVHVARGHLLPLVLVSLAGGALGTWLFRLRGPVRS